MSEVKVTAERTITAPPDSVYAIVRDYEAGRPEILTEHFSDYRLDEGGQGEGTRVHWTLRATNKRVRDCLVDVSEPGPRQLVERDENSSMVTTWRVSEADGVSRVAIETTWSGAGGVAGFFEKTFAPVGMRRIYGDMLTKLAQAVPGQS